MSDGTDFVCFDIKLLLCPVSTVSVIKSDPTSNCIPGPLPFHLKFRPDASLNVTVLSSNFNNLLFNVPSSAHSLKGTRLFFNQELTEVGVPFPSVMISDRTSLHSQDAMLSPTAFLTRVTVLLFSCSVATWYMTLRVSSSMMVVLHGLSGWNTRMSRSDIVLATRKCELQFSMCAYVAFQHFSELREAHVRLGKIIDFHSMQHPIHAWADVLGMPEYLCFGGDPFGCLGIQDSSLCSSWMVSCIRIAVHSLSSIKKLLTSPVS